MTQLDYLEYRLEELSVMIARNASKPEHRAFAKLLGECAEAAKMYARALDGDTSLGDEIPLMRGVLSDQRILSQVIDDAHEAEKNLRKELERTCGMTPKRRRPTAFD